MSDIQKAETVLAELTAKRDDHLERGKKGRKPSVDVDQVRALKAQGIGATDIAKRMGVGRASVYRALEA
jgi:DNA invertase Pin-like site-specific DNA recombinase